MSGRKKALTSDPQLPSSPLSRNSSTDTLNRVVAQGSSNPASPGISAPVVRDGFFDYSDEKSLRSVRFDSHPSPFVARSQQTHWCAMRVQIQEKLWAHGHGSPEIPSSIHAHNIGALDIGSPVPSSSTATLAAGAESHAHAATTGGAGAGPLGGTGAPTTTNGTSNPLSSSQLQTRSLPIFQVQPQQPQPFPPIFAPCSPHSKNASRCETNTCVSRSNA